MEQKIISENLLSENVARILEQIKRNGIKIKKLVPYSYGYNVYFFNIDDTEEAAGIANVEFDKNSRSIFISNSPNV